MTALEWSGIVTTGDAYRVDSEDQNGAIYIGGVDWLDQVDSATWAGPVIVALGDERFIGEIDASLGWGYSEWTAMDPDELKVGPHNILDYLEKLDGETVVLSISDESIDIQAVRDRAAITS